MLAGALSVSTAAYSQEAVEDVLRIVLANSPRISVAESEYELSRIGNSSVRIPENPELEYENVWAEGPGDGFGREIRLKQTFDFAALSGMRGRLASSMDGFSRFRHEAEVLEILSLARQYCAELVFYNKLIAALEDYSSSIEELYVSTKCMEECGEATALDTGKALIQLSRTSSRLRRTKIEREELLARLRTLAGSDDLEFRGTVFPEYGQLEDFDRWYMNAREANPTLGMARSETRVREMELRMSRSEWVPGLTLGYLYEAGRNERSHGLVLGMSIPLWRNANKVKSSAAALKYAEESRTLLEEEFRMEMRNSWNRASEFREIASECRSVLEKADNRDLLGKALGSGEISILDYIIETGLYYDTLESTLSAERDYHLALCDVLSYSCITE